MIRKLTTVALGALVLTASAAAQADNRGKRGNHDYDYARVTEVVPIVSYVEVRRPHRECWDDVVYYEEPRRRSTAGSTIVGGIVGGVIGRQFGDGRGRDAMTVVGTLVGSAIGHDAAVKRQRRLHGLGPEEAPLEEFINKRPRPFAVEIREQNTFYRM